MSKELHRKARPTRLKDVIGQPEAVKLLSAWFEKDTIPHAILFTGNSGCGKTTMARIVAKQVGCSDPLEYNCADFNGIKTIREIRQSMHYRALDGGVKAFIIDEAHRLSPEAQDALLKPTEEPPDYVYFMVCTTEPNKLVDTLRSRLKRVDVKPVQKSLMVDYLLRLADRFKRKVSKRVCEKIADVSNGSVRVAVVNLDAASKLRKEKDQLDIVSPEVTDTKVIDLVKAMMPWKGKPVWSDVSKVLSTIDENPETVRRIVMSIAMNAILKGERMGQMELVLNAFRDPVWDSKPLLVLACLEIVNPSRK